jgi:prophage regulatory protein
MSKLPSMQPMLPEAGFLREAQLVPAIVPVSRSTFWRLIKRGSFPAPVRLADRITAWDVREVRQWIASQKLEANRLTASSSRKMDRSPIRETAGAPDGPTHKLQNEAQHRQGRRSAHD